MFKNLLLSLSLLCSLPVYTGVVAADDHDVILDDEDEEGFGIPLWGRKTNKEQVETPTVTTQPAVESVKPQLEASHECIVLDDEDEDEAGVCGVPIRLPGDAKAKAKAKAEGRAPVDPELYRVVLDEEDETNESGFGIPLPTEDNPDPWNGPRDKPAEPEEDIWGDD